MTRLGKRLKAKLKISVAKLKRRIQQLLSWLLRTQFRRRATASMMALLLFGVVIMQLQTSRAAAVTIRQEINLINDGSYSQTNTAISASEISALTTTSYSGTVTYFFEIIASATSGSTGNVYLRRVGTTTNDATIAISTIGTSTSRVRTAGFTPPAGTTEYFVYADAAGAGKTLTISNARIVIAQTSNPLTATETQVEIGNRETGKSNTTASALSNPKYWRYDSSDWSPAPSFYAEAVYQRQGAVGPSFVQSKSGTNASNAAVSVVLDSVATAGNLLVAAISTSNASGPTINGWTPLTAAGASGSTSRSIQMFYKISDGTEQTISSTVLTANKSMVVSEYSGITTSSSLDVENSTTTASSTTHTSPTVTATTNNGIVVFASMARVTSSWSNEQVNASATGVNERGDAPTLINTLQLSDRLSVSSGSVNAVATVASAATGATAIAVFKAITPSVTVSLQEDDGSFANWTTVTNGSIVSAGTATTPTRVRTSTAFTPTDGRNYRIVTSTNTAGANTYDIYAAKIVATASSVSSSWSSVSEDGFSKNPARWNTSAMSSDGSIIYTASSTFNGRIYKSTNSGETWNELQPGGDYSAAWNAVATSSNGSVVIALSGVGSYLSGKIYVSTNGGTSWSSTEPAGAVNYQTVAVSSDGSVMLAAVNGGRIYKSTNSGASWSEVQPAGALNLNWIKVSMSSSGAVMLAGVAGGRLYKSTDTGASWSEVQPAGAVNGSWYALGMSSSGTTMIAGNTGARLYKSTDTGASWSEVQPAGDVNKNWYGIDLSDDGSVVMVGDTTTTGGRLYRSTDTGATWSETQPAGNAGKNWFGIAMSSDGSVIAAVAYSDTVYRSINGGKMWMYAQTGAALTATWRSAATSSDGSIMLAASSSRLYKSTDTGATWSEVRPAGDTNLNWNTVSLSSNGSIMLAGVSTGRLYKSTDTGATWSEVQPAGAVDISWQISSMSSDGSVMLAAVTNGRIYKSTDTGATWSETQPAGAVDKSWRIATMSSDGSVMLAGATSSRLYKSTNTGAAWSETQPAGNTNLNYNSGDMSSDGSIMLVCASLSRCYKSTNTGAAWSETQPAGNVVTYSQTARMSSDGSIFFVIDQTTSSAIGRVYKSIDSGVSWSEVQPNGGASMGWQTADMSSDGSVIILLTINNKVFTYKPPSEISRLVLYSQLASGGSFAGSTGLKGYYQYYDPSEWGGSSTTFTFYHEASGVSSGTADVKLQYDPTGTPTDVPNSTITDVIELERTSSALTMPNTATLLDVNVTGTGTLNSSQLITKMYTNSSPIPSAPRLLGPSEANALSYTITAPVFALRSSDASSDYVRYKIQVCSDSACSSVIRTIDQTSSQTGWSNQNSTTSTAYTTSTYTYASQLAYHTYQSPALSTGTTYYWRAAAIDPGGSNTWSSYSTISSFSIDAAPSVAPSAPTLSAPANAATGVSTTPAFQLATTDANSDYVQYYIEVCSDNLCSSVVRTINQTSSQTGWTGQDAQTSTAYATSTTIGGSTTATHTYQSPALSYNTTYYWRAKAIDPGGTNTYGSFSSVNSFTTIANSAPSAPTLSAPANAATGVSTTPAFQLATTDANSDYVQYYIEVCSDNTCNSVVRTINQSSSQTGWSGQDAQTATAYIAGAVIGSSTTATHTYQSPILSYSTTYYWRAKAIDPGGSNSYGSFSSIYSFTTTAPAETTRTLQGGINLRGGTSVQ